MAGADPASVRTWDLLADAYGAQEQREHRAVDAALRLAAPAAHETVVDLATGTGLVLRRLAARGPRPRLAVGVDRSPAMLDRVGPLPDGFSVLAADARAVPLPDGEADVVAASYVLHLTAPADRAAMLREARRLLGASGRSRLVVVTVWAGGTPAARLVRALLAGAARARPAALGGLRPLDPTPDLLAAGFTVERRVQLPRGGYPSLVLLARPTPTPRTP